MNIQFREKFSCLSFIKTLLISLMLSILSISLSVIIVLNLTPLYKLSIKVFNITSATSLSEKSLMENYTLLIRYLQWPSISKLKFIDFPMSPSGEFHFVEVKNIFIKLYILIICIAIILLILWLLKGIKNPRSIYLTFNYTFYILTFFSASILILIFSNFSQAFDEFHHLFFSNDYWLFDPATDPVILALPEQFFMVCGVSILALVIIQAVLMKVLYHRKKK